MNRQTEKHTFVSFCPRLRRLCDASPLPHASLAETIGISEGGLSNYKTDRIPKAEELYKIAKYFQVSMEFLLTGESGGEAAPRVPDAEAIRREERTRLAGRLRKMLVELEG